RTRTSCPASATPATASSARAEPLFLQLEHLQKRLLHGAEIVVGHEVEQRLAIGTAPRGHALDTLEGERPVEAGDLGADQAPAGPDIVERHQHHADGKAVDDVERA